jgi:hypothetical protein
MLGLNISSALKSVIAIYITIPFILVPLILLSGVIVKYDKMHYSISSDKFVPVVGDVMASRWAYEALMVNQFKNNAFQKEFYAVDCESANLSYELNFLVPELLNKVNDYERLTNENTNPEKIAATAILIQNSVDKLDIEFPIEQLWIRGDNGAEMLNIRLLNDFLNRKKSQLIVKNNALIRAKDLIFENLKFKGMTSEALIRFKEDNFNRSVADMVLNTNEMNKIIVSGGNFIRKDSPVYQNPLSKTGRAQFYSGTKRIGPYEIDTLWFNIMVLWLMTALLYFTLVTDLLKKSLEKLTKAKNKKK